MKNNKCIVCSLDTITLCEYMYRNKESSFRQVYPDNKLYECTNCGMIQANHSNIITEKLDFYYKNIYNTIKVKLSSRKKPFWKWKGRGIVFCWMINEYIKDSEAPLDIYELGSGYGLNLTEMKVAFPNARIYKDHHDSDNYNEGIQKSALNERKYDIIILSHVLEHLVDPAKWIREICSSLRKRGYLIIEVPNDNRTFMNRKFRKDNNRWDEPHISFFNSQSLKRLFQQFSEDLIIRDLYTSGDIYNDRYGQNKKALEKNPPSILELIKRPIKKLPFSSNIIRYIFSLRRMIKSFMVSDNLSEKSNESVKAHISEESAYPIDPLISWFTNYLKSISRKIECNEDPAKEGSLLRIILEKNV